jgi:hypothetical protein
VRREYTKRARIRIALFTARMKPAILIQLEMVFGIFMLVVFFKDNNELRIIWM